MKNFFLKTGLTLLCLIIGLGSAWGKTYKLEQVTSVSAGNLYVFEQNGHVMSNTISSSALQTVSSYKTTDLDGTESYVWTLESGTGGFYMINVSIPSNSYLKNESSTGVSFGSKSSIWQFSFNGNVATIQNKSNSDRFLGYTSDTSFAYKAYATSNLSSYAHNITVYKLVEETPSQPYTVTLGDNLETLPEASAGAGVTLPTRSNVGDYTFAGWSTTNVTEETTSAPTIIEAGTYRPTADVTLYPIYKKTSGSGGSTTSTLTVGTNGNTTWSNSKKTSSATVDDVTFTALGSNANDGKYYSTDTSWRFYNQNSSGIKISVPSGSSITKVVITWNTGQPVTPSDWTASGTSSPTTYTTTTNTSEVSFVRNTSNFAARIIEVTYGTGGATYYTSNPSGETKTLTSIEVTGTPDEFWKGDDFNHNGMTVTANYDDSSSEDVTNSATFSTPDMSTAGEKTVTVTYQDQTDTYNITVNTIANTQETAYTVAQAKELIDAGKDLDTKVYVAGTISEIVTAFDSNYGNISFNVSEDGTTTGQQFQFFRNFKGADKTKWADENEAPKVGGQVVGYGKLTKFNDIYELAEGNYLVSYSYTPPTTDFIKTSTATVNVLDPISIKNYINGEYSSYDITTSIGGEKHKDYEFVCIYDQIRFCKGGEYVVDVTGTSGSDTKNGTVTFTVTPSDAELTSVTIGGTLTKTIYTVGESFDRTGLTLTANCSDGTSADITSEASWEADPETLTEAGTVTVTVMGSYCGKSDIQEYAVTVNAAVTWDLTKDETATATADEISWTSAAVSMIDTKGEGGTAANNYYPGTPNKTYTSTRFYNGSTLTITPANGITITSIVYNVAGKNDNYADAVIDNWTNATASRNGYQVTIVPTDGTQAVSKVLTATTGCEGVTVYYTGTPVVLTLDHITISGYTTTFTEGDTFAFGGTVTAHYDDESTKDVTSSATFSDYDMNTAGTETVTVSYTENEVTKTATYDITVAEGEHGDYVLKSLADINSEDEVIITMANSDGTYALYNHNGTTNAPTAVPVTVSNKSISSPDATILWNISKQTGNTFIIHPNGVSDKWLYCTNTNNGVRVGVGDARSFIIQDNYLYEDGTTEPRYIGVYNKQDFRCYTSIEGSNIAGQTLAFYVKAKTLTSISLENQTTSFTEDDEFAFGGTVTAHYDDESTKNVTNSTAVTFSGYDMNTTGEQTVTVSYTYGGVTKEASYNIIVNAATKYTVTIIEPENGTLVVKHGDDDVTSGAQFAVGEVLDVTATPAEGYKFRNWQAVDGMTHTFTSGTKWTMTASDVTLTANFDEIQHYTIAWSVNGTIVKTEKLLEGTAVTAPTDDEIATEVPEGVTKVFTGWVTTPTVDADNAPTYVNVTTATATEAITYYAVFATKTGDGEDSSVTDVLNREFTGLNDMTGKTITYTAWSDKSDNSDAVYAGNSAADKNTIQLRTSSNSGIISTVSGGNLEKVTITWNSETSNIRSLDIYGSNTAYTSIDDLFGENKGTHLGNLSTTQNELNINDSYKYIGIRSHDGALYLNEVSITWSTGTPTSYSDFTTQLFLTTITVSKYGSTTLSLDKDYTMPEGLTGKIITAKKHKENEGDGYYTLTYVTKYNAGDVVPAGEALVIQDGLTLDESRDYRVYEGTATGEVTSYPDNLLCAEYTEDANGKWLTSFNNGVDNYYYKLTTKNGANFGWYYGDTDGKPFLMSREDRAYLVIAKQIAASIRGFALEDGEEEDLTTGIDNMETNSTNSIYNLQGLQQSKLQKGINIVNGKKVIR